MKKFFFTFATALIVSLTVQAKSDSHPVNINPVVDPVITTVFADNAENPFIKGKVTIDFGRKSKGCVGFGVCTITLEAEIQSPITVDVNKSEMTLEMTPAGQQSVSKYFGGDTIILEEDFVFAADFDKQFGLAANTVWPAGKYTLVKTSTGTYQTKVTLK